MEDLADQLGINQFSINGVSGGGAYAAACAFQFPDRVRAVSLVSSVAPFENGKLPISISRENRKVYTLVKYASWLMKMTYNAQKNELEKQPEKFKNTMKTGNKHLSNWDRKFLQEDYVVEVVGVQPTLYGKMLAVPPKREFN